MSKLTLRNGREIELGALPLDETGDAIADMLDAIDSTPGMGFKDLRGKFRDIGIAAVSLFNPGLDPKSIPAGLDIAIVKQIIARLNGSD